MRCLTDYLLYSWSVTLNKQLPWTMVWASLPVQGSNTSVQLVWRESVKQLSSTPLNSIKQGKSWQRPCIEILHVKKLWIYLRPFFLNGLYVLILAKIGRNSTNTKTKRSELGATTVPQEALCHGQKATISSVGAINYVIYHQFPLPTLTPTHHLPKIMWGEGCNV